MDVAIRGGGGKGEEIFATNSNNNINNSNQTQFRSRLHQKRLSNAGSTLPNAATTEESYLIYSNISLNDCIESPVNGGGGATLSNNNFASVANAVIAANRLAACESATTNNTTTTATTTNNNNRQNNNDTPASSSYFAEHFDFYSAGTTPKRAMSNKFSDTFKRVVNSLIKENLINYEKEYDIYVESTLTAGGGVESGSINSKKSSTNKNSKSTMNCQQSSQEQIQQDQQQQQQQQQQQPMQVPGAPLVQERRKSSIKRYLNNPLLKMRTLLKPASIIPESKASSEVSQSANRNNTKLQFDDNIKRDFICPQTHSQVLSSPQSQSQLSNRSQHQSFKIQVNDSQKQPLTATVRRSKTIQPGLPTRPIIRPATTIERSKPKMEMLRKKNSKSQTSFYRPHGINGGIDEDDELDYISTSDLLLKSRSYDNFETKQQKAQQDSQQTIPQVQSPQRQPPQPQSHIQQQQQLQQKQTSTTQSVIQPSPVQSQQQLLRPLLQPQPQTTNNNVNAPSTPQQQQQEPKKPRRHRYHYDKPKPPRWADLVVIPHPDADESQNEDEIDMENQENKKPKWTSSSRLAKRALRVRGI